MQQQVQHDPGPDQATGTSVTPTQDATTTLPPVALAPVDDPEWESAWSTYWAALESGDRHGALAVVRERHEAGPAPMEVIERLVVPAQARIGDLWLTGGGAWPRSTRPRRSTRASCTGWAPSPPRPTPRRRW